ncbi:MAG: OmpA family protein [Anaerolineae bacterium]|nr:OmpA family protein [Anaerolineae bacterium]
MARKQHEEGKANHERWLLTYADMITLLLVFFIVLYSMANTDLRKFAAVAESMRRAFGRGGGGVIVGLGQGGVGRPAPIRFDTLPQEQQDFLSVGAALADFADSAGLAGDLAVNMTYEGVIISLSEAIVFEPGGAVLNPRSRAALLAVGQQLARLDNPIRVEAHTDNVPTNHPLYPTNWELSVARAVAIVRFLIDECGIAPERLCAAGHGEYKPLVPNDSREHRAINRRAEIVILYPTEQEAFTLGPLLSVATPVPN